LILKRPEEEEKKRMHKLVGQTVFEIVLLSFISAIKQLPAVNSNNFRVPMPFETTSSAEDTSRQGVREPDR